MLEISFLQLERKNAPKTSKILASVGITRKQKRPVEAEAPGRIIRRPGWTLHSSLPAASLGPSRTVEHIR